MAFPSVKSPGPLVHLATIKYWLDMDILYGQYESFLVVCVTKV